MATVKKPAPVSAMRPTNLNNNGKGGTTMKPKAGMMKMGGKKKK